MNINLGRNRQTEPSESEIERDVAELRRLVAGAEGPQEPHPAYWQNFVVHVRNRIDEEGGRKKRRSFSTAWASVGAAALVTIVVVSGVISPGGEVAEIIPPPQPPVPTPVAEQGDLASQYQAANSQALVLSGNDMQLINAIVSESDDAMFEALVNSDEL